MKFKKEYGIIIGFVATLLVPFVAGIFVPNDYTDEKKTPASFPTSFSNDYFNKVTEWYNDHSPFRTGLITMNDGLFEKPNEAFRKWLIDLDIKNSGFDHVHKFSEWEIVKEATEAESGLKIRICEICNQKEEEIIPKIPHVHTFATEWSYDENEHWHAATCEHVNLRSDSALHEYGETMIDENGEEYAICQVCGCIGTPNPTGEHVHVYSSGWTFDDNYHWHAAICEHKDLYKNKEEHKYGQWHTYDEEHGVKARTCLVCGYDQLEDISDKLETYIDTEERPYYPYVEASKDVLLGREDWLYYLGGNAMTYYRGTNVRTDAETKEYVAELQRLQDACDKKGIQLIFAMFPNKEQVYPEYMPTVEGKINALKRSEQLNNYIQFNTDLNFTYPLDLLRAGKANYPTYYQQDSHWNEYGGAIVAEEIFKRTGWDFKGFEVTMEDHTGGDLVPLAKGAASALTYKVPKVTYKSDITMENTFVGNEMEGIRTSNHNGKKMILAGDSYRSFIYQYFAREVEESIVMHRSNLSNATVKEFIKSFKPGDIIVYTCLERVDWHAYNWINSVVHSVNQIPQE